MIYATLMAIKVNITTLFGSLIRSITAILKTLALSTLTKTILAMTKAITSTSNVLPGLLGYIV